MCGISLIISSLNQSVSAEQIHCMNDKVMHRGPDGEGYFYGWNFAMGHRRLSIIDLSEAGLQPMQKDGDVIIFNGMIYNYLELRDELISYGHQFITQTDTEVLLVACQHWGLDAFKKLNGMWAFAWYKAVSKEIILCRDYYGIKPLYYTTTNGLFAAGSEIKQFLSLPEFTPVLNKKAAVNFMVNGSLNYSEQTFFKGVKELRGGHFMIYNLSNHQSKIYKWYDLPSAAAPGNMTFDQAIAEVHRLFGDSVKKRMRADVKIGSCLSGGIDSSSIVSYLDAHHLADKNFATITSCYTEPNYDEQEYSDKVSRVTGFRAVKVFPDLNQLLDGGELDVMVYYQDQPFAGASHYSEFAVFQTAANNHLSVMLDGQGADEYLCGYDDFFETYLTQLLRTGKFKEAFCNIRKRAEAQQTSIFRVMKSYCKGAYWFPFILFCKKLLHKSNYPWLSSSWKKLADEHLIKYKSSDLRELTLQQMMTTSLPLQLHSEDRNSMMHSIESRLPFLDHRLVEYVISLPSDFKIKNGLSKYILREAINEIPELIKNRAYKMGFVAPDEPWMRANHVRIRLELEEVVHNSDIFSEDLLKRFDKFINGQINFEYIYFRAIALHRFMKVFRMQTQNSRIIENFGFPKTLSYQKLFPGIVSCSNLLADVNYC
jgi:asparagine synthase (glutamine-hydrolysing)